jgi:hypothetical protein
MARALYGAKIERPDMISLGIGIGRFFAKLWRGAKAHPDLAIVACLILLAAGLKLEIFVLTTERNQWRATAEKQRGDYAAAQTAAATKAEAARIATEAASAANARKADYAEPQTVVDQRLAADRYAVAHRLRAQADCRLSGPTTQSPAPVAAPDRDGPGPDAVVIPRAHFDQLRDNSLRLERVRLWGQGEIEAGRAVKVGD